jgi:hypothetical protein
MYDSEGGYVANRDRVRGGASMCFRTSSSLRVSRIGFAPGDCQQPWSACHSRADIRWRSAHVGNVPLSDQLHRSKTELFDDLIGAREN